MHVFGVFQACAGNFVHFGQHILHVWTYFRCVQETFLHLHPDRLLLCVFLAYFKPALEISSTLVNISFMCGGISDVCRKPSYTCILIGSYCACFWHISSLHWKFRPSWSTYPSCVEVFETCAGNLPTLAS